MEQEPGEKAKLNTARIRDYWLNGSHNTEIDREFADYIILCAPHLPYVVRTQRAFLRRVVRHLVVAGVRQFLDLGSGLPTAGNVHEVAQGVDANCRVVYVDIDPAIVDEGRALLAGNDNTCFVCADVRRPEQVLDAPELRGLLNLDEPVVVLLIDLLHHIPDSDNPTTFVAAYIEAMSSGSYLALTQFGEDERLVTARTVFRQMFGVPPSLALRDRERVTDFVTGLDLVEPGIVPIPLWRPGPEHHTDRNPELYQVFAAVARKP